MRKNNPTNEYELDALLREIAQQDNAALPFDSWAVSMLQAAEAETESKEENKILRFTQKAIYKTGLRRGIVGFASAAAMLLLLFGASRLWPLGAAAPAPFSAAQDYANSEAAPAAPAPAALAPEAPAAAPMEPAAGAQDHSSSRATQEGEEAGAAEALPAPPADVEGVDPGSASGAGATPKEQQQSAFTIEELGALQAVYAALSIPTADTTYGGAAQYATVTRLEQASVTLLPLNGEGAERQLTGVTLYAVVLDTREKDAIVYAVDTAQNVLGILKGGL